MARPIKATPRLSAEQYKALGEKLEANTKHKELVMVDNEVEPPEPVDRVVTITKEEYEILQHDAKSYWSLYDYSIVKKWNRNRFYYRIALLISVLINIALAYLIWG